MRVHRRGFYNHQLYVFPLRIRKKYESLENGVFKSFHVIYIKDFPALFLLFLRVMYLGKPKKKFLH